MFENCQPIADPTPSEKKRKTETKAEKEKAKKLIEAERKAELSELIKARRQAFLDLLNSSEKVDSDLLRERLGDYRIWHDPEAGRSPLCRCKGKSRMVKCLNPNCRCKFRPQCKAELFCSLECYLACNFLDYMKLLIFYDGDAAKVRKNISQKLYKASELGLLSQERTNAQRRKTRAAKTLAAQSGETSEPPKKTGRAVAKVTLEVIDEALRGFLGKPRDPQACKDYVRECCQPGCSNGLKEDVVNGFEKRFCDGKCRGIMRTLRRRLRSALLSDGCPVVEFLLSTLDYVGL